MRAPLLTTPALGRGGPLPEDAACEEPESSLCPCDSHPPGGTARGRGDTRRVAPHTDALPSAVTNHPPNPSRSKAASPAPHGRANPARPPTLLSPAAPRPSRWRQQWRPDPQGAGALCHRACAQRPRAAAPPGGGRPPQRPPRGTARVLAPAHPHRGSATPPPPQALLRHSNTLSYIFVPKNTLFITIYPLSIT